MEVDSEDEEILSGSDIEREIALEDKEMEEFLTSDRRNRRQRRRYSPYGSYERHLKKRLGSFTKKSKPRDLAKLAFMLLRTKLQPFIHDDLSFDDFDDLSKDIALVQEYILNKGFPKTQSGFSGQECLSAFVDGSTLIVSSNNVNIFSKSNRDRATQALSWLAGKYGASKVAVRSGTDSNKRLVTTLKKKGKTLTTKKDCAHTEIKQFTNENIYGSNLSSLGISKKCCFFCAALLRAQGIPVTSHGGIYKSYPFPIFSIYGSDRILNYFFNSKAGDVEKLDLNDLFEVFDQLSRVAFEGKDQVRASKSTGITFPDLLEYHKDSGFKKYLKTFSGKPSNLSIVTYGTYFEEQHSEFLPENPFQWDEETSKKLYESFKKDVQNF